MCLLYGARYYDPAISRWHSPDPLSESPVSVSPYNYVGNNPLSYTNPYGLYRRSTDWDTDGGLSSRGVDDVFNPFHDAISEFGRYYHGNFPYFGPSFEDLFTYMQGTEGSVWVKNSEITTLLPEVTSGPRLTPQIVGFLIIEGGHVIGSSYTDIGNAENGGDGLLINPTGLGIRNDEGGSGYWGAPRGNRTHKGIDFSTVDGQNIVSPISGRVRNFKGATTGYPMIQIYPSVPNAGFDYIEILYASSPPGVQSWSFRNVLAGDVIGISVNLQNLDYPSNVGPHIHLQIWQNGVRIDPTPFFFKP